MDCAITELDELRVRDSDMTSSDSSGTGGKKKRKKKEPPHEESGEVDGLRGDTSRAAGRGSVFLHFFVCVCDSRE